MTCANDGDYRQSLAELREAFGITDKSVDNAYARLHSWALAATGGSINCVTADGVSYSWDARPRKLANGALQGRVYAQHAGEAPRDIGGFKIDARGRVVHLPRELAALLPGGDAATVEEPS